MYFNFQSLKYIYTQLRHSIKKKYDQYFRFVNCLTVYAYQFKSASKSPLVEEGPESESDYNYKMRELCETLNLTTTDTENESESSRKSSKSGFTKVLKQRKKKRARKQIDN